jgi:hypothetical protein
MVLARRSDAASARREIMQENTIRTVPAVETRASSATEPRVDLYGTVHKGLRALLCETLVCVGATDPDSERSWRAAKSCALDLVSLCEQHLRDEDAFIEAAMAERITDHAGETHADHAHHLEAMTRIRAAIALVDARAGADRASALRELYLELSSFVADNLEHMRREETENNALLWAHFTDDELLAILRALLAVIPPESMHAFHRCMLPAMHHGERVGMLAAMQAGAPRAAFEGALALARERLTPADFEALRAAL